MATKLKILHVMTPWYPVPTKDYGGVEKFINDLLNQQAKNHSITLFSTGDSSISSGISLKYIFDTYIADQGWDRSAELIQALAVVDELKRNTYDIVHVHNLHPLLSLLHLISRVKMIFTHHSVLTKERKLIHELTREQNSKVQFIFLSNAHRNEYQHVDNAKVVSLGIDLKDFPIPEEVVRKDYFAFVGAICEQKGIIDAIEATRIAGVKLKVAGVVKAADRYFFDTKVYPLLKAAKHVDFIGTLNDEQRNIFLAEAKALLFPTKLIEPFGRVAIEALAMDTPVIGYANGALPEIVKGDSGSLVHSLDQLVTSISNFKRPEKGYCRQYVSKNFSIEEVKSAYDNIYFNVLK